MWCFLNVGLEVNIFEILFWPKIAPKEYFWMKMSGADAENHEESENSIEIIQKSETNYKFQHFQNLVFSLKCSFFLDPQIDNTPSASFQYSDEAGGGWSATNAQAPWRGLLL